jgi:hypothetical protein
VIRRIRNPIIVSVMALSTLFGAPSFAQNASGGQFHIEEKSITDIQNAIKSGQTSCKQVVKGRFLRSEIREWMQARVNSDCHPCHSNRRKPN